MKSKVLIAVYVFLKFVDLKVMIRLEKTITHYAFEIDSLSLDKFITQTEAFGFTYISQIASNILLLGLREEHLNQAKKKLDDFREAFPNEIISVSPYQQATVRHRFPRETSPNKLSEAFLSREKRSAHLVCEPYYDSSIQEAWALGYTGKGVTVAVVDTGIEIHHPDLVKNMNVKLSRSFIDKNQTYITPQKNHNYKEFDEVTEHGTLCAGVIAAERGNDICSAGVAYNATLVALKVFGIEERYLEQGRWQGKQFNYVKVHLALEHERDEIDIFSCSFNVEEPFIRNELLTRSVLKEGVEKGRHGKGSIYVFSAGNSGDETWIHDRNLETFANSIFTLVFNSMGINGSRPTYIRKGACILAATVGDHKLLTGDPLKTTSKNNGCKAFSGTSASAARAAGSIALMLEANRNLTWRDAAYIIVYTSSLDAAKHMTKRTNGAGLKFNAYFGFGLLNETAMVLKAKEWKMVPPLQNRTFSAKMIQKSTDQIRSKVYVDECTPTSRHCVEKVEQVTLQIEFLTDEASFKETDIILESPKQTKSYMLNHYVGSQTFNASKRIAETWSFSSVQFWGEKAAGIWSIRIQHKQHNNHARPMNRKGFHFEQSRAEITIYGICEMCESNNSFFDDYDPSYVLQKIADAYDEVPEHKRPEWQVVAGSMVGTLITLLIVYKLLARIKR